MTAPTSASWHRPSPDDPLLRRAPFWVRLRDRRDRPDTAMTRPDLRAGSLDAVESTLRDAVAGVYHLARAGGGPLVFPVMAKGDGLAAQPDGPRRFRLVPPGDGVYRAGYDPPLRIPFHRALPRSRDRCDGAAGRHDVRGSGAAAGSQASIARRPVRTLPC